jgi:hypothetical protein
MYRYTIFLLVRLQASERYDVLMAAKRDLLSIHTRHRVRPGLWGARDKYSKQYRGSGGGLSTEQYAPQNPYINK